MALTDEGRRFYLQVMPLMAGLEEAAETAAGGAKAVRGRLRVNDVGTMHSACLAGYGIAQVMELGVESLLAEGRLVDLFPEWPEERFPLYALHPSRHLPSAKPRVFLDFMASLTVGR